MYEQYIAELFFKRRGNRTKALDCMVSVQSIWIDALKIMPVILPNELGKSLCWFSNSENFRHLHSHDCPKIQAVM